MALDLGAFGTMRRPAHSSSGLRAGRPQWRRLILLASLGWLGGVAAGVAARQPTTGRRKHDSSGVAAKPSQPSLYHTNRVKYFGMTALSGAISTSITHSLVVPLDVIKTALQTDATLHGPRDAVRSLLHQGKGSMLGLSPFFTGARPTAVGYWLQGTFKFGGYELIKRTIFSALDEAGEFGQEFARRWQLPIMLGSAASAELVASAALCPLEVIKLRMQTTTELASLGMHKALLRVSGAEGLRALFQGFVPIALRQGTQQEQQRQRPNSTRGNSVNRPQVRTVDDAVAIHAAVSTCLGTRPRGRAPCSASVSR